MNPGDKLTAEAINSINSSPSITFTVPYNADNLAEFMPRNGIFYVHRSAGAIFFDLDVPTAGLLQGGIIEVNKWVDDGFNENLYSKEFTWLPGGIHSEHIQCQSTGEGYYEAHSINLQMFEMTGYCYCAMNDVQKGDKLTLGIDNVLTKSPTGFMGINTGVKLTAEYVNAQCCRRITQVEE